MLLYILTFKSKFIASVSVACIALVHADKIAATGYG